MPRKSSSRRRLSLVLFGALIVAFLAREWILPESFIRPRSFIPKICPEFQGPLTRNKLLDATEKIDVGIGVGKGIEALDFKNNVLYGALTDGRIFKVVQNEMITLARIGGINCSTPDVWPEEFACGRPRAIRVNKAGDTIYLADSRKGIWRIKATSGCTKPVVAKGANVNSNGVNLVSDLTLASNGDIYFTDSSWKWSHEMMSLEMIEQAPNGRLCRYNPVSEEVEVLMEKLYFPNGIQLSPREDYLIFSQATKFNLMRYNLKGPKQGQLDVFSDNLPGIPDKVRLSPRGTFWVAMFGARYPGEFSTFETLGPWPILRCTFCLAVNILNEITWCMKTFAPFRLFDALATWVDNLTLTLLLQPTYGLILEFDSNGILLRSFHSPNGTVHKVSQVLENNNNLYIASPYHNSIGKLSL